MYGLTILHLVRTLLVRGSFTPTYLHIIAWQARYEGVRRCAGMPGSIAQEGSKCILLRARIVTTV